MTAICGGGTSGPKSGVAETLIFTTGALASLLNNKGGAWAILAAPLLGVLTYSAIDFCGTDPPATTSLTTEEYTALLQLSPWDTVQSAIGKLASIVSSAIWYEFCECKTQATPAFPTSVLQPPTGVVTSIPSSGPCMVITKRISPEVIASGSAAWTTAAYHTFDFFPLLPVHAVAAEGTTPAHNTATFPTTAPWAYWGLSAQLVDPSTIGIGQVHAQTTTRDASGFFVNQRSVNLTSAAPVAQTNPLYLPPQPSAEPYFDLRVTQWNNSTPQLIDLTVTVWCQGTGPSVSQAPCTDPALLAMVGQVMQLCTLIQRQAAPFAYVNGSVYSGLTGQGTLALQGVLGASIDLTAVPEFVGVESGSPNVLFDAGWINWEANGAVTNREFLRATPHLSLPRLPGLYQQLRYSFSPGVVATVTELLREP